MVLPKIPSGGFETGGSPSGYVYGKRYADSHHGGSNPDIAYHVPKGLDPAKPVTRIIFMHGHGLNDVKTGLERHKLIEQARQKYGDQFVLVAPQVSRGKGDRKNINEFDTPEKTKQFFDQTSQTLFNIHKQQNPGSTAALDTFKNMPTTIISYSGGYWPTSNLLKSADALARSSAPSRGAKISGDPSIANAIKGVILQDSLYGSREAYLGFLKNKPDRWLISNYLDGDTSAQNKQLINEIRGAGIPVATDDRPLGNGARVSIYNAKFPEASTSRISNLRHHDLVERTTSITLAQARAPTATA